LSRTHTAGRNGSQRGVRRGREESPTQAPRADAIEIGDGRSRNGRADRTAHALAAAHERDAASPRCPAALAGIDVGIVPALAVVPEHQQVAARGIVVGRPVDEIFERLGIAGIGFPQLGNGVIGQCAALAQEIARRADIRGMPVELCDQIDVAVRTDLLHFAQIGYASRIEVVVAGEVDHHRPCLGAHRDTLPVVIDADCRLEPSAA
jgi:hypothetical protein